MFDGPISQHPFFLEQMSLMTTINATIRIVFAVYHNTCAYPTTSGKSGCCELDPFLGPILWSVETCYWTFMLHEGRFVVHVYACVCSHA